MRFLAILFAFVLGLAGCVDTETYTRRRPAITLMDQFPSYATERTIMARLGSVTVETIERSGLQRSDRRPPFNIVALAVPGYTHLGYRGDLRLEFFNDRLMSVWFYPEQYDAYLTELRGRGISPDQTVNGDYDNGALYIFTYHDYRNRRYVAWEDRRLEAENRRWIERYS